MKIALKEQCFSLSKAMYNLKYNMYAPIRIDRQIRQIAEVNKQIMIVTNEHDSMPNLSNDY